MRGTLARLHDFVKMRPETEAVIQHVGLDTWDMVLIDVDGIWIREELASKEAAHETCRALGIRAHDGWSEPRMARRMNARDHWGEPGGQRRAL